MNVSRDISSRNLEFRLTNQNKQMDDLEQKLQNITANKEAQNTDHDNNTLREAAQQAIIRQEENEAIDELLLKPDSNVAPSFRSSPNSKLPCAFSRLAFRLDNLFSRLTFF
jgi:hypothetical protein